MDQSDSECPFADRGGYSLYRLSADITGHEDARNARLQEIRVTLQIPGRRPLATDG